jgi:hypothetical protein
MSKGEFYNEIDQMVKDLIEQDKKRIQEAFARIKKEVKKEIEIIIQRDMIDNYYNGYEPLIYSRTFQLPKSVAPLILDDSTENDLQFSFGIKITPPKGASAMSHSELTLKVKGRTYTYDNDGVEEDAIFANFLMGIHPNANPRGFTSTPTTHVFKTANKAIDNLLSDGKIDKIINDVFSK